MGHGDLASSPLAHTVLCPLQAVMQMEQRKQQQQQQQGHSDPAPGPEGQLKFHPEAGAGPRAQGGGKGLGAPGLLGLGKEGLGCLTLPFLSISR